MHFVGCPRPLGTLESAPRAALLPVDLVGTTGADTGDQPPTWESYWDDEGRYLVRAVTGAGDAWFSLVDEPEATQARASRPTPRAVSRVIPIASAQACASRLVFVGARRRAPAGGPAPVPAKGSMVLVAMRPARATRRNRGR